MQNIALIGRARSGKDTAAAHLVKTLAYTRIAFADPLKEMALRIDPLIWSDHPSGAEHLSVIIGGENGVGWEWAKDAYSEVRRILQHVGQTVREYDEDFWLRIAMDKIRAAQQWNMPVVVTDCRYPNEAEALRAAGFRMVKIKRQRGAMTMCEIREAVHDSETALDDYPADVTIQNDSSVEWLRAQVEAVATR